MDLTWDPARALHLFAAPPCPGLYRVFQALILTVLVCCLRISEILHLLIIRLFWPFGR